MKGKHANPILSQPHVLQACYPDNELRLMDCPSNFTFNLGRRPCTCADMAVIIAQSEVLRYYVMEIKII